MLSSFGLNVIEGSSLSLFFNISFKLLKYFINLLSIEKACTMLACNIH